MLWEGVWFFPLTATGLPSRWYVPPLSVLQPMSSQPWEILKGHSPCDGAARAVFLGWPPALGT